MIKNKTFVALLAVVIIAGGTFFFGKPAEASFLSDLVSSAKQLFTVKPITTLPAAIPAIVNNGGTTLGGTTGPTNPTPNSLALECGTGIVNCNYGSGTCSIGSASGNIINGTTCVAAVVAGSDGTVGSISPSSLALECGTGIVVCNYGNKTCSIGSKSGTVVNGGTCVTAITTAAGGTTGTLTPNALALECGTGIVNCNYGSGTCSIGSASGTIVNGGTCVTRLTTAAPAGAVAGTLATSPIATKQVQLNWISGRCYSYDDAGKIKAIVASVNGTTASADSCHTYTIPDATAVQTTPTDDNQAKSMPAGNDMQSLVSQYNDAITSASSIATKIMSSGGTFPKNGIALECGTGVVNCNYGSGTCSWTANGQTTNGTIINGGTCVAKLSVPPAIAGGTLTPNGIALECGSGNGNVVCNYGNGTCSWSQNGSTVSGTIVNGGTCVAKISLSAVSTASTK